MKTSAFRHYGLNQAKRHQLTVQAFGGVDYTPQRFSISDSHAIDAKNYIYRDGAIQKRHGIEHILTVKTIDYIPASFDSPSSVGVQEVHSNENHKTINGIWSVLMEDGNIHVYAHIGKLMYELSGFGTDNVTAELIVNGPTGYATANWAGGDGYQHRLCYEFEDYKSSAFVGGNKLWFLGGNKYMCLRHTTAGGRSFFEVEDSDFAPVPTTTKGITAKNSVISARMSYDNVNLMTQWRKNMLLSGTKMDDEASAESNDPFYVYQLDAPIVCKNAGDVSDIRVRITWRKR